MWPEADLPTLFDHLMARPTWRLLIGRERFQESDQLYSALSRCQTTVGLHVVAGHCLVGVRDEALEVFFIPNEVCAPHSAGIRVVWQRPSLPSDDASHVRAEPIVALPDRVARSTDVVKHQLARCDVCILGD